MSSSYYVIRRTCPKLKSTTYYGVSWPAKHLAQDPFGMKKSALEQNEPLSHSTLLLFNREDTAEVHARMILTHKSLTGELPSRDIGEGFTYASWQWSELVMQEMNKAALQREGYSIEVMELRRVAELGIRSGVQFAIVEVTEDKRTDRFWPPSSYKLQPVFLPSVVEPEAMWRKYLNHTWIISSRGPSSPDL